jgi:hypothetical protein
MHAPKSWNSASVGSKTFTPSHSRTFIPTQWCSPVCKLQTNVGWNSKITQSNATFHRHMDCTWPLTKWKNTNRQFPPQETTRVHGVIMQPSILMKTNYKFVL